MPLTYQQRRQRQWKREVAQATRTFEQAAQTLGHGPFVYEYDLITPTSRYATCQACQRGGALTCQPYAAYGDVVTVFCQQPS